MFFWKKRKKGFSTIELLVVIGILGILVLIGSSNYTGHIKDAKEIQIKSEIKALEKTIEAELMENDKFVEGLKSLTEEELKKANESNSIYDSKGNIVTNLEGPIYVIINININLGGTFIMDEDNTVLYYDDKNQVSEDTVVEEPAVEEPTELLPNSEEDFLVMNSNGGMKILGYKGTRSDVIIPETIFGLPVNEIGGSAFKKGTGNSGPTITSVSIPTSVTVIGSYAFQGNELKIIKIPKSIATIGIGAFWGNPEIEEIINCSSVILTEKMIITTLSPTKNSCD